MSVRSKRPPVPSKRAIEAKSAEEDDAASVKAAKRAKKAAAALQQQKKDDDKEKKRMEEAQKQERRHMANVARAGSLNSSGSIAQFFSSAAPLPSPPRATTPAPAPAAGVDVESNYPKHWRKGEGVTSFVHNHIRISTGVSKEGASVRRWHCVYCWRDNKNNKKNNDGHVYDGSTSNITKHLWKKHRVDQETGTSDGTKKKMTHFFDKKSSIEALRELRQLQFVITDLRPFSIFEGTGFKAMMMDANPDYRILSEFQVSSRIDRMYQWLRSELRGLLASRYTGLALDKWKSESNDEFYGVTAFLINHEQQCLERFLLGLFQHETRDFSSEVTLFLKDRIAALGIEPWQIVGKAADNANGAQAIARALPGGPQHGCEEHSLQLQIERGLALNGVKELLERLRQVVHDMNCPVGVKYFRQDLDDYVPISGIVIRTLPIYQDSATRWNSKFDMLHRALDCRAAIEATTARQVPRSDGSPGKMNLVEPENRLSEDEWLQLGELHAILKPLSLLTDALQTQSTPLASPFYLLVASAYRKIAAVQPTSEVMIHLRDFFLLEMKLKWQVDDENSPTGVFYSTCMLLDPNTKQRILGKAKKNLGRCVALLTKAVSQLHPDVIARHVPAPTAPVSMAGRFAFAPKSAASELLRDLDLEDDEPPVDVPGAVELEVSTYLCGKYPAMPALQFWFSPIGGGYHYHHLKALAEKLYCAQITSVSCEQVYSTAGFIETNRWHLSPSTLDALVTLKHNDRLLQPLFTLLQSQVLAESEELDPAAESALEELEVNEHLSDSDLEQ